MVIILRRFLNFKYIETFMFKMEKFLALASNYPIMHVYTGGMRVRAGKINETYIFKLVKYETSLH